MKRSGPPARKTPLKRSPMKRSPHTAKTKRRSTPNSYPTTVVAAVSRRSGQRCELRHPGCRHLAAQLHHRKMRSQGGGNTAENLMHLCAWCHTEIIHRNTAWAYRHGLLVHGWDYEPIAPVAGCGTACEIDHTVE